MIGLLLLYWIGKYFYKLADEFEKSKWGFTVLGIVVYYTGTIVFAITFVIVAEIVSPGYIDTANERTIDLISLPFGLLSCYLLFKYLKKTWTKNDPRKNNSIDEIGVFQEKIDA
jgi:hypothetical protein